MDRALLAARRLLLALLARKVGLRPQVLLRSVSVVPPLVLLFPLPCLLQAVEQLADLLARQNVLRRAEPLVVFLRLLVWVLFALAGPGVAVLLPQLLADHLEPLG